MNVQHGNVTDRKCSQRKRGSAAYRHQSNPVHVIDVYFDILGDPGETFIPQAPFAACMFLWNPLQFVPGFSQNAPQDLFMFTAFLQHTFPIEAQVVQIDVHGKPRQIEVK